MYGDDHKIEKHESYGMIGVNRQTGGNDSLFGSSIKHNTQIAITIKRGEKNRHLNTDWYYGRETITEIVMSPTQFAEMITSLNAGDGVPCTLRRVADGPLKRMDYPPEVKQRQVFEDEFKKDMESVTDTVYGDVKEATDLLYKKGTITLGERKKVANIMHRVVDHIKSSLPFVQTQFNEAMDKTVLEAKGEVEGFIQHKITSLGIKAMRDKFPQIANEEGGEKWNKELP